MTSNGCTDYTTGTLTVNFDKEEMTHERKLFFRAERD